MLPVLWICQSLKNHMTKLSNIHAATHIVTENSMQNAAEEIKMTDS